MGGVRTFIEYPVAQVVVSNMNQQRADFRDNENGTAMQQLQALADSEGDSLIRLSPTEEYPNHNDDVALWQFDYILYTAGQPAAISWYDAYRTTGAVAIDGTTLVAPVPLPAASVGSSISPWIVGAAIIAAIWFIPRISR